MGRTTYESLPFKASANRQFIVVSSGLMQPENANVIILRPENLYTFLRSTGRNISLIGGMSLLTEENLKLMDKIYMTEVKGEFVADVFLPSSVYDFVKSKESVPVFHNDQAEMRLYA
nr:DHFR superfamily protein [Proteus mirabilis]